jgi:ribosome-associated translation inhibitor RaiA
VVVSKDPERNHAHEDIYVAMRDAVDAAKRQLQRYEEEFGGKHAQHEQQRFENRPEQQPD